MKYQEFNNLLPP